MHGVSPLWLSFSGRPVLGCTCSFILQAVGFGSGLIGVTCHLYRFCAGNWAGGGEVGGSVVNVESRKLILTLGSSHILQFSLASSKADLLLPNSSVFFLVGREPKVRDVWLIRPLQTTTVLDTAYLPPLLSLSHCRVYSI